MRSSRKVTSLCTPSCSTSKASTSSTRRERRSSRELLDYTESLQVELRLARVKPAVARRPREGRRPRSPRPRPDPRQRPPRRRSAARRRPLETRALATGDGPLPRGSAVMPPGLGEPPGAPLRDRRGARLEGTERPDDPRRGHEPETVVLVEAMTIGGSSVSNASSPTGPGVCSTPAIVSFCLPGDAVRDAELGVCLTDEELAVRRSDDEVELPWSGGVHRPRDRPRLVALHHLRGTAAGIRPPRRDDLESAVDGRGTADLPPLRFRVLVARPAHRDRARGRARPAGRRCRSDRNRKAPVSPRPPARPLRTCGEARRVVLHSPRRSPRSGARAGHRRVTLSRSRSRQYRRGTSELRSKLGDLRARWTWILVSAAIFVAAVAGASASLSYNTTDPTVFAPHCLNPLHRDRKHCLDASTVGGVSLTGSTKTIESAPASATSSGSTCRSAAPPT